MSSRELFTASDWAEVMVVAGDGRVDVVLELESA
jgi:hypothetical protein